MNKKVSRLLKPGMRLYFTVIVVFIIAAALVDYRLGVGFGIAGLLLAVYSKITTRRQRNKLLDYVEEITYKVDTVRRDHMLNFPLPMVIFRLDNEEIIWSNQLFFDITGTGGQAFELALSDVIPGFHAKWLMEGKTQCPDLVQVGGRKYQVFGNIVRLESDGQDYRFLGNAYWMDVTEYAEIDTKFQNTRPVCVLIVLDNYEELLSSLTEKEKNALLTNIGDVITQWCAPSGGFLCKFDRDRYIHIVEEQHFIAYVQGRFSLLDRVRKIVNSVGIAATISIGIGKDSGSFAENYEYAKLGMEMALSRGGDQAVVRNSHSFAFYGGRATAQERRTKVKSRVTAGSLEKLMHRAEKIFIMGHHFADFDSLGAACGVCCLARKAQKEAKIIINLERHAIQPMLERLLAVPEYQKAFISPQDALVEMDSGSLLVVVDTNRPDQVESPAILEAAHNVVVIDHHRRAADYIQNAAINFHEPYASSSSELATELLQYTVEQADILRVEAEALMAGLMMDTKNFTMRTGSRTFEAAAFLRRAGAGTADVKRFMQSDFSEAVARYDVIRQASLYRPGFVISAPENEVERVTAALAADELLNISGIQASFVLFPSREETVISARSFGDVNVQFILEKLGGGGNKNTAGAQVRGKPPKEVLADLKAAIDAYCEEDSEEEESDAVF